MAVSIRKREAMVGSLQPPPAHYLHKDTELHMAMISAPSGVKHMGLLQLLDSTFNSTGTFNTPSQQTPSVGGVTAIVS